MIRCKSCRAHRLHLAAVGRLACSLRSYHGLPQRKIFRGRNVASGPVRSTPGSAFFSTFGCVRTQGYGTFPEWP